MTVDQKQTVVANPSLWIREPMCALLCQGCGYPILQRLLCELLEEMKLSDDTIALTGCGCHSCFFQALNVDGHWGAHGRPPDVATAMKRLMPESFILTLQGDGDAIAIGTEPLIQAGARGEKITILMANNGSYGNTGGQMAPTSLIGQVTSTSPTGRDPETQGYPIHATELMAQLDGVVYAARGALSSPVQYTRTKKLIRAAFQKQIDGVGLGFVEILLPCPTNWHLSPLESMKWIEQRVIPLFPLGEFKNVTRAGPARS